VATLKLWRYADFPLLIAVNWHQITSVRATIRELSRGRLDVKCRVRPFLRVLRPGGVRIKIRIARPSNVEAKATSADAGRERGEARPRALGSSLFF
jgi:hypothetical protein